MCPGGRAPDRLSIPPSRHEHSECTAAGLAQTRSKPGQARPAGRSHDIEEALATMRPGQAVRIVLIRDQQPHTAQVSLGRLPGG